MKNNFYLVHESILPSYYKTIIEVRKMINDDKISVSDACKEKNISRSTYYKYKNFIFVPNTEHVRKANIVFIVQNQLGVLSNIINKISEHNASIISINQDTPIQMTAYVLISIAIENMDITLDELIIQLKKLSYINSVELRGLE